MKALCLLLVLYVLLISTLSVNADAKKYNDLVHGTKKYFVKEESIIEKKPDASSNQKPEEAAVKTNDQVEEGRSFLGLPQFPSIPSIFTGRQTQTTNLALLNQILGIAGLNPVLNPGVLTTTTLNALLTSGGALTSPVVSNILNALGLPNPNPGAATLNQATLTQILNAITTTIPGTTVPGTTGGTEIGIAAAVLAGIAGLIALVAPIALGIVIGVLIKGKYGGKYDSIDYEYYDDVIPALQIGYNAQPIYVPPPTYSAPKTYGTLSGYSDHGASHGSLSSYGNYRRSDKETNLKAGSRKARSTTNRPFLNRVSEAIRGASEWYSKHFN